MEFIQQFQKNLKATIEKLFLKGKRFNHILQNELVYCYFTLHTFGRDNVSLGLTYILQQRKYFYQMYISHIYYGYVECFYKFILFELVYYIIIFVQCGLFQSVSTSGLHDVEIFVCFTKKVDGKCKLLVRRIQLPLSNTSCTVYV